MIIETNTPKETFDFGKKLGETGKAGTVSAFAKKQ